VVVINVAGVCASATYGGPHVHVNGYAAYTNNIPCGAFRGFGAPQAQFAAESMVTRLAQALGMDPVDLRRRNIYREGSIEPTQQPLPPGVSALPVLERCVEEAKARLGYGSPRPVPAALGLPFEREEGAGEAPLIEMVTDDSSQAPNAGSASASRMTLMGGRAVHDAAQQALEAWAHGERPARATAQYRPPATTPLDDETTAGRPNYAYGYVSQAVEVEVNTLTGQVQVLKVISVHDVGRAVNRQQVEGQIEGCLAQAVGYALLEHFQMRDGLVLTPYFSTYLLPTALDMPTEIVPVILELADPNGPYGARGMSEMPLVPLAPAIAAAIHDATGVWLTQQPMTPERVFAALGA
jgi:CO/xanthine dehydrogenase Mo-binding subunit